MNAQLQRVSSLTDQERKPDLVLLHGWGVDNRIWQPVLPHLERYFNLHLIDFPGYGTAQADEFPADLDALLLKLLPRLPASAAYLGWSLGGAVATALAARYPGRVSALVSVATNPCFVSRTSWPAAMPQTLFEQFSGHLQSSPSRCMRRFSALQAHGDDQQLAVQGQLQEITTNGAVATHTLERGIAMLRALDVREDLLNIQIPYLAILGTEDKVVPIELAESLQHSFNTAEIWQAAGCGHAPQRSRPTALAARVVDFLLEQPAQARAKRAKTAVAQSFGRAHRYDQAAGLQRETGEELLELMPVSAHSRVVDLGCGSGYFTPRLASKFSAAHLLGVDIATGMLERAREADVQADWLAGDAEQLPLADASVDLLYSNLAVQWCENLTALSQEIERVLRPDGYALLSTLGPSTLWELRAAWRMLDRATHVNSFANPQQLRNQLAAAGLSIEVCRVENWTRRVGTVQQLARELRDIGAHNVNSGRQLGLTGRQRWRDLDQAYRQLHDTETDLPVTWQLCFLKVRKIAVAW